MDGAPEQFAPQPSPEKLTVAAPLEPEQSLGGRFEEPSPLPETTFSIEEQAAAARWSPFAEAIGQSLADSAASFRDKFGAKDLENLLYAAIVDRPKIDELMAGGELQPASTWSDSKMFFEQLSSMEARHAAAELVADAGTANLGRRRLRELVLAEKTKSLDLLGKVGLLLADSQFGAATAKRLDPREVGRAVYLTDLFAEGAEERVLAQRVRDWLEYRISEAELPPTVVRPDEVK